MRVVSLEEIVFSRENVFNAGPPGLHDQGGSDAAARRPAAAAESFLDVLGVTVPCAKAGGLISRVSQVNSQLRPVQAGRAAGGRCRAALHGGALRTPRASRCEPELFPASLYSLVCWFLRASWIPSVWLVVSRMYLLCVSVRGLPLGPVKSGLGEGVASLAPGGGAAVAAAKPASSSMLRRE